MKKVWRTNLGLLALLVASTTTYGGDLRCQAKLSGAQEVPGVTTNATGYVAVRFDWGMTQAKVGLRVRGAKDAVGAHFHCNRAGLNGPVAFGLFSPGPLLFDGERASGTLTNADFIGSDCEPMIGRPVNNIAALALAMQDDLIYVNVHTPGNPGGEVRGQLTCTRRAFDSSFH